MKWIYHIRQKMQVALLLGIIVVVVYANNVMENRNVTELGGSFSSVYEDRLLVESYIYKLSEHLYQKKIMLDQCRTAQDAELTTKIDLHNMEILTLIHNYENTRLTETESMVFGELKSNIGQMAEMEQDYMKDGNAASASLTQLDQQFIVAARNLSELSMIQIEEAKKLNDDSKKIIAGFTMLTNFEMVMLIVIGLIIQVLILSSSQIIPRQVVDASLN
jgi:Four helix bundle sensory module for signal transduction